MNIQFSGVKLDDVQRSLVNGLSKRFCKACPKIDILHINIKKHQKAGNRVSYTINLRARREGRDARSVEVTDWDFAWCAREVFKKLEKELRC